MTSLNLLKIATAVAFGVPSLVAQAEEVTVDGLLYNIEDGVASVGVNYTPPADLVIPSKITYEGTEYPVKSIGDYAFNCAFASSVIISEGIESIGESAFQYCMSPTYQLPSSLRKIGLNGFNGCSATDLVLPEGLEEMGEYALANCYSLVSVTIPGSLKKVPAHMLEYSSSLTTLTLEEGIEEIGESAFSGLSMVESVTLPSSLKRIETNAFQYNGLLNLTLPASVEYLGSGAFSFFSSMTGAMAMETLTIEAGGTPLETAAEGDSPFAYLPVKNLNIGRQLPQTATFDESMLETLEFGPNCKRINGFTYLSNVKSVKISDGVETIGAGAISWLMNCPKLEIPRSVTKIEEMAMNNCINLEELTFADSDTPLELGVNALQSTDDPKKAYIGRQFTGERPNFARFTNQIIFGGGCKTIGDWSNISPRDVTFLESVETIEENAFCGSEVIEGIHMTNVKTVGAGAFDGNFRISTIDLSPTLTSIGDRAFCCINEDVYDSENTKLTKLTLPASLQSIGAEAFAGYKALRYITCEGSTPATLADNAFDQINYEKATLNVPSGSSRAYINADGWKQFANILSAEYFINISCSEGGHAEVDGTETTQATVARDSQPVITIVPDADYEIASVTVDGEAVTVADNNTITLEPVTIDMDVVITFARKSTLDSVYSDSLNVSVNGRELSVGGDGRIEVTAIDGRRVYEGENHNVTLPAAGIYIVTKGTSSVKVMAK